MISLMHCLLTAGFGTTLVLGACASSIDEPFANESTECGPSTSADAEPQAEMSHPSTRPPIYWHPLGEEGQGNVPHPRHCNYGEAWHCMAGQQAWHWVPLDRTPREGRVSGVESLPAGTGDRCCVRVGPRQPRRPYGT